jgi:hypothetical protein
MKISKLAFIVLLFISNFSFSQDYLKYNAFLQSSHKYNRDSLSDFELRTLILQNYDSAFNCVNNNGFINDYINGMEEAIKINNLEKAADYYLEALKKGATKWYIKNNVPEKEYVFFKKTPNCKEANKIYRKNKKDWKIKKNRKLCRKVEKIIFRDQMPRRSKPNYKKMAEADSINIVTLRQIYNDIGRLPNVNDVGKMRSMLLEPPLLHFPPEEVCFFANILLEMYLKGEYDDLECIFSIIDQASYRYGACFAYENNEFIIKKINFGIVNKLKAHKQSFGFTDFTIREKNGYWYHYVFPVYDREYADSIRKYFGYNTFEELSATNKYYIYDEELFIEKWGEFIERDIKDNSEK